MRVLVVLVLVCAAAWAEDGKRPIVLSEDGQPRLVLATLPADNSGVGLRFELDLVNFSLLTHFIPDSKPEALYLYDSALPIDGINGVGRPTLVEVDPDSELVTSGTFSVSVEPLPDETGLRPYPKGPVVITLPLYKGPKPFRGEGESAIPVLVTYQACADQSCRKPVSRKPVMVPVPPEFLTIFPDAPKVNEGEVAKGAVDKVEAPASE